MPPMAADPRPPTRARRAATPRPTPKTHTHTTRKPRRDAQANREKILRSAQALFHERGLVVGLHEIARHAGLGAGTVYRHFPNRAALISALYEDSTAHLRAVARQAAEAPDAWDAVNDVLFRSHEIRALDRGLWAIAMHSARRSATVGQASFGEILEEIVTRAHESGELRSDFVATDINVLNIMIAACADFTNEIDPDLWRRFVTILIDGLCAERSTVTPLPGRPLTREEVLNAMFAWYDAEGRWGPEHRRVASS
jgi:AcrR family transcriptional regulator